MDFRGKKIRKSKARDQTGGGWTYFCRWWTITVLIQADFTPGPLLLWCETDDLFRINLKTLLMSRETLLNSMKWQMKRKISLKQRTKNYGIRLMSFLNRTIGKEKRQQPSVPVTTCLSKVQNKDVKAATAISLRLCKSQCMCWIQIFASTRPSILCFPVETA